MDFVAQLKAAVDIVKVVGQYLPLKKSSAMRYIGLCPFHTEKTPSFSVHAGHQFFKCFGCGQGGDVLEFVMQIEQISFYEALKLLAERNGIPMPKRSEYSDPDTRLRAAVFQMHELAEQAYREHLTSPAGVEARAYLEKRGVTPEIAGEFGLGYSDRTGRLLVRLFERHQFPPEQLEASGLVARRQDGSFYDRFRNRLMFPIHNETGKPIGFGGRALADGDEPKYLNSSETPIYKKSHVLYNLHRAKEGIRKQDRAILVEGYMDAIGVFAAGNHEVVAPCGTALTTQQIRTLRRHSGRMVVNFDPDAAGAAAAERSINLLLEEGIKVRIVALDGGLDPDEYCRERGAGAYQAQLEQAKHYFYWLAERARARFDMRSAEGRVQTFQFLLPAIQRLSDKLERLAVVNDLASYLGVEAGLVLENFRKAAAERNERRMQAVPMELRPHERILLPLLLSSEEARRELLGPLKQIPAIQQFQTRRIFQALFALHEAGTPINFHDIHARLEESDKDLMTSVALADETVSTAFSLDQGIACLRELEQSALKTERSALKTRIKEAERAGNLAEALRLTQELSVLEKGHGLHGGGR